MINIVVLGAGHVGTHLSKAIDEATDLNLLQWYNRSQKRDHTIPQHLSINSDISTLPEADLYIIAVSDDAVDKVSNQLPFDNRLVVHTSGSVPMRALNNKNRRGVLYPLQTFSKSTNISFNHVPLCIEASDKKDRSLLKSVAQSLESPSYTISSEQRQTLHLAAVFVNNFTNQLFRIGHELTDEKSLDFEILKPLIQETANKVQSLSPYLAQTGPAKRKDSQTLKKHLGLLENHPNFQDIYKILTQSIQNTHD
ncbi:MAG: Rossmann-like and DUF2520 domain-containing protein [Flavobacteriaceae bacterium]